MRKTLVMVFVSLSLLSFIACTTKFDGSRTGNDSQLVMDFKVLNKTDYQLLELEEGDIVDANIVNDSGQLDILVQRDDDEPIYESVDVSTTQFQIEIPASGTYKFQVTGTDAKGSISFIKQVSE